MNVEEQRLNTFRDWPGNAAVESSRIAQAGFYFTGPGLEVTCFSCGCHISDWNYGDQVMTRHRIISPNCAFVRDPVSSGNVPLTINRNTLQTHSPIRRNRTDRNLIGKWESQPSIYKSELARLESFNDWPIPFIVTPESLAEAGFFFLHQGDRVQCAFCAGIVCRWEQGDIAEVEHKRHFPACPFLLGLPVGNIPRNFSLTRASTGERICALENFEELGIQRHRGPKHSKFSTVESRLKTFTNWPSDLAQQPIELAQAGFFYVGRLQSDGIRDRVRCFHCDGGLKYWEPQDEPWSEHALWYPTCPFLLLVKGQEFVNDVQRLYSSNHNQFKPPVEASTSNSESKPSGLQGTLSVSMPSLSNSQVQEGDQLSRPYLMRENPTLEEGNRRQREARQSKLSVSMPSLSKSRVQKEEDQLWRTYSMRENPTLEEGNRRQREARQCKLSVSMPSLSNSRVQGEDDHTVSENLTLEEENRRLREARQCKICMDAEVGAVLLPCGHLVTCVDCAPSLQDCPVCRQQIKATIRTFLS